MRSLKELAVAPDQCRKISQRPQQYLVRQFEFVKKGPKVPEGELYVATEVPKGELGFYFVSDGSGKPFRMRLRAPSFIHAGVSAETVQGTSGCGRNRKHRYD